MQGLGHRLQKTFIISRIRGPAPETGSFSTRNPVFRITYLKGCIWLRDVGMPIF